MMKKILSLLLAFTIMLSLCACEGNWGSVNLKDPVEIPENGVIKVNVIKQVKQENAIGVFTGKSGDYKYEWTIFGSDVSEPKEINLGVRLSKINDGYIKVVLNQTEAFGFSALLSIYLNEKWDAQGATAYANDKAIASAGGISLRYILDNLSEKEQHDCLKQSCMYIWMFSINDIVYYGRTWEEFREFLKMLDNYCSYIKIVFVHNLSFEFQFLWSNFKMENVFARKSRKVMKCEFMDYNIELRCSLFMSNCSLDKFSILIIFMLLSRTLLRNVLA